MARPRKPITLSVSSSQAVYVLERAVADRKLSAADVDRYIAQMHKEISSLEARIAHLRDAIVGPVKKFFGGDMPFPLGKEKVAGGGQPFPLGKKDAGGGQPFPLKKRKMRVSAARKASMQLQGQYLSLFTKLPKKDRATYKALAKKDGRETAIAAMKMRIGK